MDVHLQDFVGPWRLLILLDHPQDPEDLVDHFSRNEAAQVHLDVLHEGHRQQRDPRSEFFFYNYER